MARRARAYSAAELAKLLDYHVSHIRTVARTNGLEYETEIEDGQEVRHFFFRDLPEAWQAAINAKEEEQARAEERARIEAELTAQGLLKPPCTDVADLELTAHTYSEAADYNRAVADRRAYLLNLFKPYQGAELKAALLNWNRENPDQKPVSYPTFKRWLAEERAGGFTALIGKYGASYGKSAVTDEQFSFFWGLYGTGNGPPANACWRLTRAKFCTGENVTKFPSCEAFMDRLRREMPQSQIDRARLGETKWRNKWGHYIERDYTDMRAGEVWVSDHAQIDVISYLNGKPVCGWITSMIDMRTDKALSVYYHVEPPNSDHIFRAFFEAADKFGLPETLYIDNGKDYRCKDFAGGRPKKHALQVDEQKTGGMLGQLGITVHFSLPYVARSKTVERWHLQIKEGLSRHCIGYRGGHTQERPEILAEDIKAGKCLDFDYFKGLLTDFIFNVLNKKQNDGKRCEGRSPDDVWNDHNPVLRKVSRDALKLFCMRTTNPLTIGRNGVNVSRDGLTYWGEWMTACKGRKVYLRRADDNYGEAWVFSEEADEFLGKAQTRAAISALGTDEITRAQVKNALAEQRREKKTIEALAIPAHVPSIEERLDLMKKANALENPNPTPEPVQKVTQAVTRTNMQKVVNLARRQEQEGKADLSQMTRYSEIINLHEQIERAYTKLFTMQCDLNDAVEDAVTVLIPKFADVAGMPYDTFRERCGLKQRRDLKRGEKPAPLTNIRHLLTPDGAGIGAGGYLTAVNQ